jgi:hypothetical protein
VLNDGVRNKWGMTVFGFASPTMTTKRFSELADLEAVKVASGLELQDRTVQEHVQSDAFVNEHDTMIERGIVYGYPLWSSIALHLQQQQASP